MGETILQRNIVDQYKIDMQSYAIALNRKQSVPEVKDGLKSVNRRILIDMFLKGFKHNSPYVKCATVVGDTMGRFHPHGDSSIYGTLVLMANWYDIKMPLIDGHGNYGNSAGASPAAPRYTECRLSEFSDDCILGDLYNSKGIIDWVPNFDGKEEEPEYLPVKVPLLLINGTFGIGIGMRSEIPSHNINEVIDATLNVLANPDAPVVLIPDHCMGCNIIDTNWKQISNTGCGRYRVRANIDIEYDKEIPKLVITGIPNSVTLFKVKGNTEAGIIAKINEMARAGILPQITRIYPDSKKEDLRYVIQLKRGSDPNYVKDYLYKHTQLEDTYRVNFEVLDGINGVRFSYKSYIEYFIDFSITLKIRSYAAKYQEAKTEWRKLQLYIMVMESGEIDNIQKKIRNTTDISPDGRLKFKEWIINKFKVTDIEADFIMGMDLMKLAKGYLPIYKQKCEELKNKFDQYFIIMNDDNMIKKEIADELIAFKKKYGQPRKCKVIKVSNEADIPAGEFKIIITKNNFIKKINPNDKVLSYRNDEPKFVLKVENTQSILIFDKMGKVFKLPVHKVALGANSSQGFDLRLLIKNCTSEIASVMYEPTIQVLAKKVNKHFLTVLTRNNCIKKLDLDDFLVVPPSGILYTKLNEGDYVQDISIIPDNLDIILYSDTKALSFNMKEVPHYKRTALGVAAMNTDEPIDGLSIIYPNATDCIVITKNGYVNKFNIVGLKRSNRNKAGSSIIRLGKTDSIFQIYGVSDNSILKVTANDGETFEIAVKDIKSGSSIVSGTKLPFIKGSMQVVKTSIRLDASAE